LGRVPVWVPSYAERAARHFCRPANINITYPKDKHNIIFALDHRFRLHEEAIRKATTKSSYLSIDKGVELAYTNVVRLAFANVIMGIHIVLLVCAAAWRRREGNEKMQKSLERYSVVLKRASAIALALVFVFTPALIPANITFAEETGNGGG
jgi:uncharacterized membrane protein YidH (DUF202 family)